MAFNAEKILVAHQYFIEDGSQIKVQNKNDEGDWFFLGNTLCCKISLLKKLCKSKC